MGRNGKPTREKILKESKELIYENGFAGTSIDLILAKTGITKGAFFYHFKTKADLAVALVDEFVESDLSELENVIKQTEAYKSEPKERLLKFIDYFIDMFSSFTENPNCLYASVSNEQNQYSSEIKKKINNTLLKWREVFEEMIEQAIKKNKPRFSIDKESLADHFTVVLEGAFIMSKALNDPMISAKQLVHLRQYFDLLFE